MNPITPGGCTPDGVLPLCILCVDDNCDVADSEVDLLLLMGFDARACYDGATALVEAAKRLPGVCLIDLNMPGMDGDELAVLLRACDGGASVLLVAVTAMSDDASRVRIRAAGFDRHLVKPVDPNTLIRLLLQIEQGPRDHPDPT